MNFDALSPSIQSLLGKPFEHQDGGTQHAKGFSVGTLLEDGPHGRAGEILNIDYNQLFAGHMMMPGKTGTGKSYLITSFIAQLLLNQHHAMVCIDPIGGLYKRIMAFLSGLYQRMTLRAMTAPHPLMKHAILSERDAFFKKVILLDFTQKGGVDYGFNPLEVGEGYDVETTVGDVLRLFEVLFGDMSQMRRLQNVCRALFLLTASISGSFEDMARLIMADGSRLRNIVEGIANYSERLGKKIDLKFARIYLNYLCGLNPRERQIMSESTYNALNTLGLSEKKVYNFFVAERSNLFLKKLIDEGYYLFVNLEGKGDMNTSKVIGASILNRLVTLCSMRPEVDKDDPNKKVVLIADEMHKMVGGNSGTGSNSFSEVLSTCRNYGLMFCGAFQYYGQFEEEGNESLKMGLTANIRNTFHFQLGRHDAEELASSLGRPDGQKVLRRRVETAYSKAQGYAYSISEMISQSIAFAKSFGKTESISLSNGESVNVTISDSTTIVEGKGWSVAKGENWSQATMQGMTFSSSTAQMEGGAENHATGRGSSLGGSRGN
ncbi:MAG: DUF87 domain-containing protein, partial [Bacteroidota bacterium]